jgi:hypothetical protein
MSGRPRPSCTCSLERGASGLKSAWRSKECLLVPTICTRATRKMLDRATRLAAALSASRSPAHRAKVVRDLIEKIIVEQQTVTIRVRRGALSGRAVVPPSPENLSDGSSRPPAKVSSLLSDGALLTLTRRSERDSNPRSLSPRGRYLRHGECRRGRRGSLEKPLSLFRGTESSNPSQCRYDSLMAPIDVPPVGSLPKPSIMDNSYVLSI